MHDEFAPALNELADAVPCGTVLSGPCMMSFDKTDIISELGGLVTDNVDSIMRKLNEGANWIRLAQIPTEAGTSRRFYKDGRATRTRQVTSVEQT